MTKPRKMTRKKLILEDEKVQALADLKDTSKPKTVREAVDFALAAEEIAAAIRGLYASGGIDDVFGKLPAEDGDRSTSSDT